MEVERVSVFLCMFLEAKDIQMLTARTSAENNLGSFKP